MLCIGERMGKGKNLCKADCDDILLYYIIIK